MQNKTLKQDMGIINDVERRVKRKVRANKKKGTKKRRKQGIKNRKRKARP